MFRFAPWSHDQAPVWFPRSRLALSAIARFGRSIAGRRYPLRPMRNIFSPPNVAGAVVQPGPLGGLGQLARLQKLLADLPDVAGGAVGPLGDHAVGNVGGAAELELEQGL